MNSPTVSKVRRTTAATVVSALALSFGLGACNALDPYADKFEHVSVGDTRASVLSTMGTPSNANSLQLPMISVDSLAWRAPTNNKLYLILIAMDRVVAKSAIQ